VIESQYFGLFKVTYAFYEWRSEVHLFLIHVNKWNKLKLFKDIICLVWKVTCDGPKNFDISCVVGEWTSLFRVHVMDENEKNV